MSLSDWINEQGGAVHSSAVRAAGYSRYAVDAAIRTGAVKRVRRSWLVTPACSPDVVRAVTAGGRLTCISAAKSLELWTPDHAELHIAVAPTSGRFEKEGLRVHWSDGPAPFDPHAVKDPLINLLYHVARCQEPVDALAVWESALRKSLIALEVLTAVLWRSGRVSRILELISLLSDSGLETHFVALMRSIGLSVRQQVWLDSHPVDALIGDRLVIQLDGFAHHNSAAERRRDLAADVRLRLRGYTVFRFDYRQVLFTPEFVIETVRAAVAQGLHLAG